jgi:hypothetical protein
MAGSQVVVRYRDGALLKGTTKNFVPARDGFHVQTASGETVPVSQAQLKAIFFVRNLAGDPKRSDTNEFNPAWPALGRKLRVEFADGEVLVGTTQGWQPNRPGFFMFPADVRSNNERCFIITAATRQVVPL